MRLRPARRRARVDARRSARPSPSCSRRSPSRRPPREGNIDHVETKDGKLQVLYSLPGAGTPRPTSSRSTCRSTAPTLDATAALASTTKTVRRTAILAIDVSESMAANGKFTEAKAAAQTFLDSVSPDLYVGIVTFAGKVTVAQEPTTDRDASKSVIDGLEAVLRHLPVRRPHAGRRRRRARRASAASSCCPTAGTPRRPSSTDGHGRHQEGGRQGGRRRPGAVGRRRDAAPAALGRRWRHRHQRHRPEGPRRRSSRARRKSLAKQILVTATPPAGERQGRHPVGLGRRRRRELHRRRVRDPAPRVGRTRPR